MVEAWAMMFPPIGFLGSALNMEAPSTWATTCGRYHKFYLGLSPYLGLVILAELKVAEVGLVYPRFQNLD